MVLDVWFEEDVVRNFEAVLIAHGPLTPNERKLVQALAAGFGMLPKLEHVMFSVDLSAAPAERNRMPAPFLMLEQAEDVEL